MNVKYENSIKMTNEQINQMARYALSISDKNLAGPDWYGKSIHADKGIVLVYDGNGDYVYDFFLNEEKIIHHKLKDSYQMDEQTKKMVKKVISDYEIMYGTVAQTKTLTFEKGWLKRLFGTKAKEIQK